MADDDASAMNNVGKENEKEFNLRNHWGRSLHFTTLMVGCCGGSG